MFGWRRGRHDNSRRRWLPRLLIAISLTITLMAGGMAGLITIQSYPDIRDAHLEGAREQALLNFRAAVNVNVYPTLVELIETGTYLASVSNIEGGAFFDSVGEYRGHFGSRPELTWHGAKLDEIEQMLVDDGRAMEFFVDPSDIDLDHGLVLRFDLTDAWNAIDAEIGRKIVGVVSFVLAAVSSLTLVVAAMVILPVNRLETAIRHALNDPKGAVSNSLNLRRRDEIGRLARAVDQLFYVLSNTFEEDLGNALAIQAHTPFPMIIYNADGSVADANQTALAFFDIATPKEAEGLAPNLLRLGDSSVTPLAAAKEGQYCTSGEVRRGEEWVPALIGGDIIHGRDGAVRRYFVVFADITFARDQIAEAQAERDEAAEALFSLETVARQQRHLLDACIAIIDSGKQPTQQNRAKPVMPDRFINTWYREAIKYGYMEPDRLRHPMLPSVRLSDEFGRKLFANALFAVHSRSGSRSPKLLIKARVDDQGRPVFTITEISDGDELVPAEVKATPAKAALFCGALVQMLNACEGRLLSSTGRKGENMITFELPATGIRMKGRQARNDDRTRAA